MVGADGSAFLAWHTVSTPPKDGGQRLQAWLRKWREETGAQLA
jgi:hypothetical protein